MALANKAYDPSDTLVVALDLEFTNGLSDALEACADIADHVSPLLRTYADALRMLAGAVDDARISAGLEA